MIWVIFMATTIKIIEVIGSSDRSWEEAAQRAVADASKTVRGIVGADVINQTAKVKDGKIIRFKTTLKLAFEVEE
jgi:flavin-binding protein dodecin